MRVTISTYTLIKILGVLLALYFAYLIRDVLVIIFTTVIFASAIDPWVDWMQKMKIPRAVGILFIYLVLLLVVGLSVYLIIPPMATQFAQLANDLPAYADKIGGLLSGFRDYSLTNSWLTNLASSLGNVSGSLPTAASSIVSSIFNFFGGVFSFILVLVITFYLIVQENLVRKLLWSLTPEKNQAYVMDVFKRMQHKLGLWLRGQLVLCLVIFALTYIGLSILGVKYALVLALIAGTTEFIPYLGPIIGAVPAVFLAFTQSPMLALFVIILYIVVQQIENNLLVPKIMEKAVGLNPIVSIVVLMIGFSVGGILGAILSIPVATAGTVLAEDYFHKKHVMTLKAAEEDN